MNRSIQNANLYLDEICVGTVRVLDWHNSWGFGAFLPNNAFAKYKPLYDRWAQLMRDVDAQPRLTRALSSKLRDAECALYAVHSELFVPDTQTWHPLGLLNIDDTSIEWKESGQGRCEPGQRQALKEKVAS